MTATANLLTLRCFGIVVRNMRRLLQIKVAFEVTRTAADDLRFAYEQVVPIIRRQHPKRIEDKLSDQRSATEKKKEAI